MEDQQKSNRKRKQSENNETSSQSVEKENVIDDRVQFRVAKKIAKVIFQNNDPKIVKKNVCVQLGLIIEEIVRQKIQSMDNYRSEVLRSIENIQSSFDSMDQVIKSFEKDSKKTFYKRKLSQIISK